jgi:hypothetical protein
VVGLTGPVLRPVGPALAPVGSALAPIGSVLAPIGTALAPVIDPVGGLLSPVVSGLPLPGLGGSGTGAAVGPGAHGLVASFAGFDGVVPASIASSLTIPARPAADGASSPARSIRSWPALTGAVSLPGFPASAELPAGGPDPLSTSSARSAADSPGRTARASSRVPTSRSSLPPSDLGRRAPRPRTALEGENQVNLWMKRAIGVAALGGGLLALGAGSASAQEVSADVSARVGRPTSAEVRSAPTAGSCPGCWAAAARPAPAVPAPPPRRAAGAAPVGSGPGPGCLAWRRPTSRSGPGAAGPPPAPRVRPRPPPGAPGPTPTPRRTRVPGPGPTRRPTCPGRGPGGCSTCAGGQPGRGGPARLQPLHPGR